MCTRDFRMDFAPACRPPAAARRVACTETGLSSLQLRLWDLRRLLSHVQAGTTPSRGAGFHKSSHSRINRINRAHLQISSEFNTYVIARGFFRVARAREVPLTTISDLHKAHPCVFPSLDMNSICWTRSSRNALSRLKPGIEGVIAIGRGYSLSRILRTSLLP